MASWQLVITRCRSGVQMIILKFRVAVSVHFEQPDRGEVVMR
jgi:hypothetical protein